TRPPACTANSAPRGSTAPSQTPSTTQTAWSHRIQDRQTKDNVGDPEGGERHFRGGSRPSPDEVITVVEQCGDRFGVEPICRVLGYRSASTVYARRNRRPSARQVRDEQIMQAIGTVRVGHAACYGAGRTWLALRRAGVDVARCTVERLMRQHGLIGVQRGRKAPRTTTSDRAAARPPD